MPAETNETTYSPDSDAVRVREALGEREGYFTVTLPISSDRTARDQDRFSQERLRGFATQINSDRTIPVFLSHGRGPLTEERYGATGKIGRVRNADIDTRDGTTLLMADLEIADPDDLAEEGDTGDVEEALRWVRQQFRLGLGAVSVGWNEDTGNRDVPGDAELLECSVVGLASDTEAQQASAEPTEAAVRGFEALPDGDRISWPHNMPEGWGFRRHEHDAPTDAERAEEALEALQHVREFHTQDDDRPPHMRRDNTPPALQTVDAVREAFGGQGTEAALAELWEGRSYRRDRRDILLDRLADLEDAVGKLSRPRSRAVRGAAVVEYALGTSRDECAGRITEAIDTLRDALTEDEETAGWGLAAVGRAAQ